MGRIPRLPAVLFLLALPCTALAQAEIPLTISGNEARGTIALPGGIGAELTLTFEQAVGLNAAALEVSAALVSPLDLSLLGRLPSGGLVTLPGAFPVLLRIEPSLASGLSFSGIVVVSLHTNNLVLNPQGYLALYSAPLGGAFADITRSVGIGSYRVGGSSGGFSEFLIASDLRPADLIIGGKFDTLQARLDENAGSMPATVAAGLQTRLTNARALYDSGAIAAAATEVGKFGDDVKAKSGAAIPDVWRANDPRVNVAGVLRAGADTLKFSLNQTSPSP